MSELWLLDRRSIGLLGNFKPKSGYICFNCNLMEKYFSKTQSRVLKTLRVRKRLTPDLLSTKDESFIDEDPANFFCIDEEEDESKLVLDEFGNLKRFNYIGPPPSSKTPVFSRPSEIKRVVIKGFTLKLQNKGNSDPKSRFREALNTIEKNKKRSEKQEKKLMNQLSPREKIVENRQKRILDNYQIKNKYWGTIQKSLSQKTMKSTDKLLSSIGYDAIHSDLHNHDLVDNHIQENLYWYLNLRNAFPEKSNTFIPVGNTLTGLYTIVKGKKSDQSLFTPKSSDLSELQVIGLNKLSLEIEAVESKGPENLDLDLIDRDECEEVIAQQYDKKVLAGRI